MRTNALLSAQYSVTDDHSPSLVDGESLEVAPRWHPRDDHRYRGTALATKRALDVAGALILITTLAPLMLVTAMAVRISSRGPALYRQTRIGRHGRPFTLYKFRTMHPNAEEWLLADLALYNRYRDGGFKLSCDEDPRITRIGLFLRRSSIDELPQLVNVLRGEMSLVGPRPVLSDELDEYGPYLDAYLMAVPGLTGAWQVSGRDAVKFPGRARFDAQYIDQWSLGNDLRILAKTVPAAVSARGVE